MTRRIVLLSGPLAVGKTAVADVLAQQFNFKKISSSAYLTRIARERELPNTRDSLQQLGDLLDNETDFGWLVERAARCQIKRGPDHLSWLVDAVRKPQQVQHFRQRFEDVLHVHFTAPEAVLRERFLKRSRQRGGVDTFLSYKRYVMHSNEQISRALGSTSDLTIDLSTTHPKGAAEIIFKQ